MPGSATRGDGFVRGGPQRWRCERSNAMKQFQMFSVAVAAVLLAIWHGIGPAKLAANHNLTRLTK
jgi:hypothetical protein